MQLSAKQKAFINEPYHRYNIKHGATRSGKTFMDYYVIPMRIRERAGKPGLIVLMGNSRGTLQRNVIDPMREIYGDKLVTSIKGNNTAYMFGEQVYCLGADIATREDKIRGMSIKYCYADEITTWRENVFTMLKSRLDKPYSTLDATCNPKEPTHWVKQFIDSAPDVDVWNQQYCLDDNPFLDPSVKAALKAEHKGVFYERFVLGRWCVAEGLVFPYFANDASKWVKPIPPNAHYSKICIGVDFGATGSLTTAECIGISPSYGEIHVLAEDYRSRTASLDTEQIAMFAADFILKCEKDYGRIDWVFGDAAEPALINRISAILKLRGSELYRKVTACKKTPLSDRPYTVDGMLGAGRLTISPDCKGLIKALSELRWDEDNPDVPEDVNADNINDYWDAFCYSWSHYTDLIDRSKNKGA